MSLELLSEVNTIRQAMATFSEAKRIFDELALAPIHFPDGSTKTAVQEAQALMAQAREHHVTIDLALKELLDPKTAQSEAGRLLAQAQDHHTELNAVLTQVQALVGADLGIVLDLISGRDAANLAAK